MKIKLEINATSLKKKRVMKFSKMKVKQGRKLRIGHWASKMDG